MGNPSNTGLGYPCAVRAHNDCHTQVYSKAEADALLLQFKQEQQTELTKQFGEWVKTLEESGAIGMTKP